MGQAAENDERPELDEDPSVGEEGGLLDKVDELEGYGEVGESDEGVTVRKAGGSPVSIGNGKVLIGKEACRHMLLMRFCSKRGVSRTTATQTRAKSKTGITPATRHEISIAHTHASMDQSGLVWLLLLLQHSLLSRLKCM